jgi:HEPN domain-containing protein
MKSDWDTAQGWLRKAESDLAAAELCLQAGKSLDTACFHCQQATEKALKAWLIANSVAFPFSHDLTRLLAICSSKEMRFQAFQADALNLNPFAVEMRYDDEFWPTTDETKLALDAANRIHSFVIAHFPLPPNPPPPVPPGS